MRADVAVVVVGSVAGNVNTTNTSTHDLGTMDVDSGGVRIAIMGISWTKGAVRTVATLTIGGESLTEVLDAASGGSEDIGAAIWIGDVSAVSGVQAIEATFSGGAAEASGITGVVLVGLQSETETMSDGDFTAASAQMTITGLASQPGGIAFACGGGSGRADAATWGTLTERSDVQTGTSAADMRHTVAWDIVARSAADETLDFAGGTTRAVVGAGFR